MLHGDLEETTLRWASETLNADNFGLMRLHLHDMRIVLCRSSTYVIRSTPGCVLHLISPRPTEAISSLSD